MPIGKTDITVSDSDSEEEGGGGGGERSNPKRRDTSWKNLLVLLLDHGFSLTMMECDKPLK